MLTTPSSFTPSKWFSGSSNSRPHPKTGTSEQDSPMLTAKILPIHNDRQWRGPISIVEEFYSPLLELLLLQVSESSNVRREFSSTPLSPFDLHRIGTRDHHDQTCHEYRDPNFPLIRVIISCLIRRRFCQSFAYPSTQLLLQVRLTFSTATMPPRNGQRKEAKPCPHNATHSPRVHCYQSFSPSTAHTAA